MGYWASLFQELNGSRKVLIKFNRLSWRADIDVHVIHISCVIIAYILEPLSSLTWITHTLQAIINYFQEKNK